MSNYWESGKAGKSSQRSPGSWNSNPNSTRQSSGPWNSSPYSAKQSYGSWNSNPNSTRESSGCWNSNPYSTKQSYGSWNSNPFDSSREKNRIAVNNWRVRDRQSRWETKSLISHYTEDNRSLETDIRAIENNMKYLRDTLGAANRASNGRVFNSPEGKEMMKNLK